jgi:hypothetical protein
MGFVVPLIAAFAKFAAPIIAKIAAFKVAGLAVGKLVIGSIVAAGTSFIGKLFKPSTPYITPAHVDRYRKQIDPNTPRKIVFGRTLGVADLRYYESSSDYKSLTEVYFPASHDCLLRRIWLGDKLVYDNGAVLQAYTNALTVVYISESSPSQTYNLLTGTKWGNTMRCSGLPVLYINYFNLHQKEHPFAQGIPDIVKIEVDGARVYDPRVVGVRAQDVNFHGSWRRGLAADGSLAVADAYRNPALQMLFLLLGWKIQDPTNTSRWTLVLGEGNAADDIDMSSFIAAANICDEPINLLEGGTHPRYRSDSVYSD